MAIPFFTFLVDTPGPEDYHHPLPHRILARFLELPGSFAPEIVERPSPQVLLENVRKILDVFAVQHFVNSATAIETDPSGRLKFTVEAPANWWSFQVLKARGDNPTNDFIAKAIVSYYKACQLPAPSYQVKVLPSSFVYTFK